MRESLIKMIAVTWEICGGREPSDGVLNAMVDALESYNPDSVGSALLRCQREVKNIGLKDITDRIEDGRPGAEEAWAMIPLTEDHSVVWTTEMAEAFGAVRDLMGMDDERIAARMSFKEAYTRICADARAQQKPIKWEWSPGHDESLRQRVLLEAVEKNRLTAARALELAPHLMEEPLQARGLLTAAPEAKRLPAKKRYDPDTGIELVPPGKLPPFPPSSRK